jgi:hypothetical protein
MQHQNSSRLLFALAITAGFAAGSACQSPNGVASREPSVVVREAPPVQFRGANSPSPDKPGDADCNNPGHWDGNTLFVFNSTGHPWRSSGPDLFHLTEGYLSCQYDNKVNGGRWIECTWKARDGVLYGWYHNEPGGLCPGTHLTAPRIGAVRSTDNGATWQDLGVILDAPPNTLRCDTKNYYFAGGNGDFSAMVDPAEEYIYFFISTYTGGLDEQGVAMARMRYADRDQPVGKAWKWHAGTWQEPGLGGRVTSIFPARKDWHQEKEVDAFWGPSIHWNTHLRQYVILLNRAIDSNWKQEGVYVTFNTDLARPDKWTAPKKILESQGADRWYPVAFGTHAAQKETDKLVGRTARLFLRGQSRWELEFVKP